MVQALCLKTASGTEDMEVLATLAREIWEQHYMPIIGAAQVKYMVDNFQSAKAIGADVAGGYVYTLAYWNGTLCGYSAVRFDEDVLFLNKLYVLQAFRGKGIARGMLLAAEDAARQRGLKRIRLTCNKHNEGSLCAYARMGFDRTAEVITDIGGGFVMDDYVMEKRLPDSAGQP